ncbi:MAG: RNA polymerase sigma-54 factor [Bacteroidetes bacterium]|nr:MAG: RNA polymerase sigma-54 factor [Bacteroidota bacterium]
MLKQGLQQKLLQKLSPQQIQFIKLLQVPTFALEQRIKEELEDNPALEEGKDDLTDEYSNEQDFEISLKDEMNTESPDDDQFKKEDIDIADYIQEDEIAGYKLVANNRSDDDEQKEIPITMGASFQEMLAKQLSMVTLSDHQHILADQIIGSIDDDGYLRRELLAIVDDLAFTQNVMTNEEELLGLVKIIQLFDPPGVGARDLQECLLIQLRKKEPLVITVEEGINIRNAVEIVENNLDAFTKKHYEKLYKILDIDKEEMKDAIDEILKLNPKPGSAFSEGGRAQHIIPDFTIINNDGELELKLNSRNAPELKVSRSYKEMMQTYDKSDKKDKNLKNTVQFVKQKLDSAKWFIDAIKQRQDTLMKTMSAIMRYQYDYFLTGDDINLRPMVLKNIADIVRMDLSTISRVANSKYVQTEFGTYLLKSFFSESIQKTSGEEVSTREVKQILTECINSEDKKSPLPDERLTEILKEKGYQIARRTIAKYREQLSIPVARLRKQI